MHTGKLVPITGFLILSAMVLLLFGFTVYEAWILHSVGGVIVLGVLFGLLLELKDECKGVTCPSASGLLTRIALFNFIAVLGGAILTYALSVNLDLGAVIASSLVGVIAALVVPAYGVPLYCGAFVGMTSAQLLVTHGELAIAGAVAGVVYLLTTDVFSGFGGKLGTIAFTGSVITGLGLAREFLITPTPEWDVLWIIMACSIIATVSTYTLNVKLGHGPVMASSVVGLTGGLILPALYPEIGSTLAIMAVCASFAGMSGEQHFPRLIQIVLVGAITGAIFIYSMPLLGGAGGKLGTIAFGSVLAVKGYVGAMERVRKKELGVIRKT